MNKQAIYEYVKSEVKRTLKAPFSAVFCPLEELSVLPQNGRYQDILNENLKSFTRGTTKKIRRLLVSSILGNALTPSEGSVSEPNSTEYVVKGYVDSQNSFGAMLRTNFAYRISESASGRYSIIMGGVGDDAKKAKTDDQIRKNYW